MVTKLREGSFFGQSLGCRAVPGITLTDSLYHSELFIPPHEHATAFFDFVVGGFCSEFVDKRTRNRARSTLAFHPAGEVHHSCWHGSEARCFHIEIAPMLLDRVRKHSLSFDSPVCFDLGTPNWIARRIYDEFHLRDDLSSLVIEALTLELLVDGTRLTSSIASFTPPRWLERIPDLLRAEFSQSLTLDQIAGSVGVHPSHLARVFRRVHGCTVGDYVRHLRIEFACDRLRTTDASLVEIALAAGFSDQSHFSKTFKRQTGMSPAIFKKSFRARKSYSTECSDRTRTRW
jgi:AraC family transcriptional regulator